ncbi:MAG: TonB-dependent receptor [Candidatus Kapabacteria bacterium]|nr:TonB-dependent receptor [Candidatus Kapabacteria bacterium]
MKVRIEEDNLCYLLSSNVLFKTYTPSNHNLIEGGQNSFNSTPTLTRVGRGVCKDSAGNSNSILYSFPNKNISPIISKGEVVKPSSNSLSFGVKWELVLAVLIPLLLFIVAPNLYCQDYCAVRGKVIDSLDYKPVFGAKVWIAGTRLGCLTNKLGEFNFDSVRVNKYKLMVHFGAFEKDTILEMKKNETISVNIYMRTYYTEDDLYHSYKSHDMVVTATRHAQAIQDVPITVGLVKGELLANRNINRLDEALLHVPGVTMNGDQISIRGSSGFAFGVGSRVALLVDGFPMLSGDQGDIKMDALPLFNTEKIEIVKGAGSALYGTSALGGVVNVITKAASIKPEFNCRISSGFFNPIRISQWKYTDKLQFNSSADLSYSQRIGDLGFWLSGGYYNDNNYRKQDRSERYNIYSKIKYGISQNFNSTIFVGFARENSDDYIYWNSLDSATYPGDTNTKERIVSSKYNLFSTSNYIIDTQSFLTIQAGIYHTVFNNFYDASELNYRSSSANAYNIEAILNSTSGGLNLTYGLKSGYNTVESKVFGGSNHQILAAIYSQAEYSKVKDIIFTLGVRADYDKISNSDENLELSPKLGISYKLTDDLSLRLSGGRGFRSPLIAERFASLPYSAFKVVPNPALKPEKSWSFEIGANYNYSIKNYASTLDLSIFDNELADMIEPKISKASAGNIQFMNVTHARIYGMEISHSSLIFNLLGIEVGAALMNPRDLDSNTVLKYRPKISGNIGIWLPLGFMDIQAEYRHVARVATIDPELLLQIPNADVRLPINVIDLRTIFNIDKISNIPLKLTFNIKNLTDYYFTKIPGNLAPVRFFSLQATLKL